MKYSKLYIITAVLAIILTFSACSAPSAQTDTATEVTTVEKQEITKEETPEPQPPKAESPKPETKPGEVTDEEAPEEVIVDNDPENSLFTELDRDGASSDFVALIVNQPSDDILDSASILETYSYDQSGETLLIVPRYENSLVELKTLRMGTDGELEEAGTIYRKENTEDGYGLFLYAARPEGVPSLSVTIVHEGMASHYRLSYDGVSGTPDLEYVEKEFDLKEIDETVKFNYREAAHVFNLDYKAITSKFGEPEKQEHVAHMYISAIELKYGDNIFKVEQTSGYVYETELCDNTIMAPRGLGVSSTSAAVLTAFPNESDGSRLPMNDDSGLEYEVLYSGGDDSAAAIYDGDSIVKAQYRSGAVVLEFLFEDDIVQKIIYRTEF